MLYLILATLCVAATQAQINSPISPPIPLVATDPGLPYNRSTTARAPIVLEAFIDLNCGDSAYAFGELKKVAAYYGAEQVDLVFQQLALPYHRNAFLQTQVSHNNIFSIKYRLFTASNKLFQKKVWIYKCYARLDNQWHNEELATKI